MIILKVPYAEKDEAKALGARWNSARKTWYVPDGQAAAPFERWLVAQKAVEGGASAGSSTASGARTDSYVGKVVVGAHFISLEHACDPFAQCAECHPALEASGWIAVHAASVRALEALDAR
ncbi:MAG: DUF5710 domain-containing protein [Pseudomonadota bacterium]